MALVKNVTLPRSLTATGLVFLFNIHIKKNERMLKQLRLVWLRVSVWVRSLQGKLKC